MREYGLISIDRKRLSIQLSVTLIAVVALLLCVSSCQSSVLPSSSDSNKKAFEILTGSIGYPNDLYFPARIRVEIELTAQNRFTNEKRALVTQTIRNPQRFPVNFIIRYASEDILSSDTHSIAVRVFQENMITPYLNSKSIAISFARDPMPSVMIELETVRLTN